METSEPVRILIVDDSRIFRNMLQSLLEQMPGVQVVGSVFSGEKALEFIDKSPPDLITLDVEMPGLSGLETLREIAKRNVQRKPLPPVDTILISALTKTGSMVTVEGLQLGALDFVCKPSAPSEQANRDSLRRSIEQKLTIVRQRRGGWRSRTGSPSTLFPSSPDRSRTPGPFRAIAIGTSTGGPEALGKLLPSLAQRTQVPIFVIQHILEGLSGYLADSLSRKCGRPVVEVQDDLVVQAGGIYLAKSGRHMVVRSRDGIPQLGISDSPPEKGCRPAVDVFLRSAAMIYGSRLVSAILTGMGDDGADGVRAVKRAGGYVVAQDEASSVVWGMPRAAAETGIVDEIVPLSGMADCLAALVMTGARR